MPRKPLIPNGKWLQDTSWTSTVYPGNLPAVWGTPCRLQKEGGGDKVKGRAVCLVTLQTDCKSGDTGNRDNGKMYAITFQNGKITVVILLN